MLGKSLAGWLRVIRRVLPSACMPEIVLALPAAKSAPRISRA